MSSSEGCYDNRSRDWERKRGVVNASGTGKGPYLQAHTQLQLKRFGLYDPSKGHLLRKSDFGALKITSSRHNLDISFSIMQFTVQPSTHAHIISATPFITSIYHSHTHTV